MELMKLMMQNNYEENGGDVTRDCKDNKLYFRMQRSYLNR